MTRFIIRVIGMDGRRAYLDRSFWAADKASATRYASRHDASMLAELWLGGQPDVRTWVIEAIQD